MCLSEAKGMDITMKQLYTRWGREADPDHVLAEYPRPLMVRESYVNLNGYWDYAFTKEFRMPEKYEGKILVPFSPESLLSGVSRQLQPDEYLWYRRCFHVPAVPVRQEPGDREPDRESAGRRLLLHFGAVDQACAVYVNERKVARHTGGYLPFEADITEAVRSGENELVVSVKDLSDTSYHARGKQKLKRGGMYYTAQSGIWQTVWMEEVPEHYIRSVEAVTDLENGLVRIRTETEDGEGLPVSVCIERPGIYMEEGQQAPQEEKVQCTEELSTENLGTEILCTAEGRTGEWIEIPLPEVKLWNCEEPWLYYFTVRAGEDTVKSYFAMRKFSVERDEKGIPRICLNGKVQFQNGVLDQGYWPDGLYTAPSDEAFIFDIKEMKKTGFNMVRKHLKIESQRWYYHCDRMGMAVWQDMVNGGGAYKPWFVTYLGTVLSWRNIRMRDSHARLLAREDERGRQEFVREMKETIRRLKGHPSICTWVIFNEGWGQFQTEELTRIAGECDPDRLIDQASGWFDQGGGDFKSVHNYFFKLGVRTEKERAYVLSEIGGYTFREEGHCACEEQYGYGAHGSKASLNQAYGKLMKKVEALIPEGLCASVYTQWSDVEEEVNGVYTYDRECRKISSEDTIRK